MFRIIFCVMSFCFASITFGQNVTVSKVSDIEVVVELGKVESLKGVAFTQNEKKEYDRDDISLPPSGSVSLKTVHGHLIEVKEGNKEVTLRIKKPFIITYFSVGKTYYRLTEDVEEGILEGYQEVHSITKKEMQEIQSEGKEIYVITFGADWCKPCHFQRPITYSALLQTETHFFFVDVDNEDELAQSL